MNHAFISAMMYLLGVFLLDESPKVCSLIPLMFYIGRETRDLEKLGFVDWPGIIAPSISILFLFFIHTNIKMLGLETNKTNKNNSLNSLNSLNFTNI